MNSLLISRLRDLFADGADRVHVIADFDGTLTKEYVRGQHIPSLSEVLRVTPGVISEEYQNQSHALYKKYSSILNHPDIPFLEKKAAMQDWWESIEKLNVDFELERTAMDSIASSDLVRLRDGSNLFIKQLAELNIPLIIFSASGFGDAIKKVIENHKLDFSNIQYVTNIMKWDKDGKALGYHRPLIHTLNKDETVLPSFPEVEHLIKERYNVLLLGNSTGDLGMAKGHRVDKLVTIGFLDKEAAHKQSDFEKDFDITIVGDDFLPLLEALQQVIKHI